MTEKITDIDIAEELVADLLSNQKSIIIYNDDVNSFEHVIECLVKYCGHDKFQAEQCAVTSQPDFGDVYIHYKGKYAVKSGSIIKLLPICKALLENNLLSKIE